MTLEESGIARRRVALARYEDRTAWLMIGLALLYLAIYSVQVLWTDLPSTLGNLLNTASIAIWLTFALDLAVRAIVSGSIWGYLVRHPVDVIAVAVPAFRFLRVLRILTAGQWLVRRGARLAGGQTAAAVAIAVAFLAYVGALAVLDAERGAQGAQISSLPDALWWAFVTMSTVGYGDLVPVTDAGRLVAVAMMIVGIGLLGVVSATLASAFLSRLQADEESEIAQLHAKVDALQVQIARLSEQLEDREGG